MIVSERERERERLPLLCPHGHTHTVHYCEGNEVVAKNDFTVKLLQRMIE